MKTTFSFLLTGLALLLLMWACTHTPEPEPTDPTLPVSAVITTPTGSTILSTTYTIPTSPETAYANVPQPPAGCRITRTVYKTVYARGDVVNPEEVTIDGKVFTVCVRTVTDYTRDSQGRIVKDRQLQPLNLVDSVTYTYSSNQVVINKQVYEGTYNGKIEYRSSLFTVLLDKNGIATARYGSNNLTYDPNGILIKADSIIFGQSYSATVGGGNILDQTSNNDGGFGSQTDRFTYFLKRPNLPVLLPFYGSESRNLPAGFIRSLAGSIYYGTGDQYQMRYVYVFDNQGRVRRRVSYGASLKSSWPFTIDPRGIGILDYEYGCP